MRADRPREGECTARVREPAGREPAGRQARVRGGEEAQAPGEGGDRPGEGGRASPEVRAGMQAGPVRGSRQAR